MALSGGVPWPSTVGRGLLGVGGAVGSPASGRLLPVGLALGSAEALSEGTGHSFEDAFAEVLKTPAGRRLAELADGPHRHEKAAEWQAGLLADREARRPAHLCEGGGVEGHYSWLGRYVGSFRDVRDRAPG